MNGEEYRRMQLAQQQRTAATVANPANQPNQQNAGQGQPRPQGDPNMPVRYSSSNQPQRTSYSVNSNVYSRYRPTRPPSYRNKNLSQTDVLRALSQYRPPESLADMKQKLEKVKSKDSVAVRHYLEPYQK